MKKTILFVEDEGALQQAATYLLEQRGYRVLSALDGAIGLDLALKERPDIILLDLALPKKSGFEVLDALRKSPSTASIPVIILSNLEGAGDVEKAVALGSSMYLVKAEYKIEEIADKIDAVLKTHEAR